MVLGSCSQCMVGDYCEEFGRSLGCWGEFQRWEFVFRAMKQINTFWECGESKGSY